MTVDEDFPILTFIDAGEDGMAYQNQFECHELGLIYYLKRI